jgi:hypothetical protein
VGLERLGALERFAQLLTVASVLEQRSRSASTSGSHPEMKSECMDAPVLSPVERTNQTLSTPMILYDWPHCSGPGTSVWVAGWGEKQGIRYCHSCTERENYDPRCSDSYRPSTQVEHTGLPFTTNLTRLGQPWKSSLASRGLSN